MSSDADDDGEGEAPKPKGPLYITPAGFQRLRAEYEQLGSVERPRVVHGVTEAAAEGDRSENAEYIYGKRRLRQIDSRMRFLRKILEASEIVDPKVDRGDRVYFGATVEVETEDGDRTTYQVVGEHETDAAEGKISYRSPIGAALLRKQVDDEFEVATPKGRKAFTIVAVHYR